MIILGIDPGTARMGYGVVEVLPKNKLILIETDTIITPVGMDQHKRLLMLHKKLLSLVKEYTPHIMVIEKLFFNSNAKTAMTVGQARGVALLAAASSNLDVFEYTALQAKLVLTGYGRSDKKQMQEAVREFFNLENAIKSDDANDAVAMALCHIKKKELK